MAIYEDLKQQSAKARSLALTIAEDKNSLIAAVIQDYRKKRNRKKFAGITRLIQNHCYTIEYSSDEEEYEIIGVLTRPIELYQEVFSRSDYEMLSSLLKQDQNDCQRLFDELQLPENDITKHYDPGLDKYFAQHDQTIGQLQVPNNRSLTVARTFTADGTIYFHYQW